MKYLFVELGAKRLGGGSRCNLAIADILKGAGNEIKYYDISNYLKSVFTDNNDINEYYPLRNVKGSDIIDGAEPFDPDCYHAYHSTIKFSEILMKLGNEADVIFAGVDYLNHSLAVTFPGKFISYLHCAPVFIQAPLINEAKLIISNSSHTQKVFMEVCNGKYSPIITPPVDPSFYNSSISLKDRKFDILFYGRIAPDKFGTFDFKDFYSFMESENFNGNIVGSRWMEGYDFNGRMNTISNAKFSVIKEVLGNSKIYIHTKKTEDYGQSILEAVCSGCVALVPNSDDAGYDDIPGVLHYSSQDDLKLKVKAILSDPNYYQKFVQGRIERATDLYKKMEQRVLQYIK